MPISELPAKQGTACPPKDTGLSGCPVSVPSLQPLVNDVQQAASCEVPCSNHCLRHGYMVPTRSPSAKVSGILQKMGKQHINRESQHNPAVSAPPTMANVQSSPSWEGGIALQWLHTTGGF